jgi:hypothetical protein
MTKWVSSNVGLLSKTNFPHYSMGGKHFQSTFPTHMCLLLFIILKQQTNFHTSCHYRSSAVTLYFGTINNMKMAVFWVVAPCSLVDINRCFRGACCFHHQSDKTSINIYQTTRRNKPEDSSLHTRRLENLKSHINNSLCPTKMTALVTAEMEGRLESFNVRS